MKWKYSKFGREVRHSSIFNSVLDSNSAPFHCGATTVKPVYKHGFGEEEDLCLWVVNNCIMKASMLIVGYAYVQ
jgi:hypothetical protein